MALLLPAALVALTTFPAPAWACLLCLTTFRERSRVCRLFVGSSARRLEKCEEAFQAAFLGLRDTEFNYDERGRLHDAFTQMIFSLEEMAKAHRLYRYAFLDAAETIQKTITQLKAAPACVPPCGLQEAARRFRCRVCFSYVCNFPLDCPVKDMAVRRGRQALFSCTVNFALPEGEILYTWKFARGMRTRDQSYFRDLRGGRGSVARVRPVQPEHRGTFCCLIWHDEQLLARLYYFLNVTAAPPLREVELQAMFRDVLRWTPGAPGVPEAPEAGAEEPTSPSPSLAELLAQPEALTRGNQCLLAAFAASLSATATLLVWTFCRWYYSKN